MKYKQEYEKLLDKVEELENTIAVREQDVYEARNKKDIYEAKYQELQSFVNQFEGKETDIRRENEWLMQIRLKD